MPHVRWWATRLKLGQRIGWPIGLPAVPKLEDLRPLLVSPSAWQQQKQQEARIVYKEP